MAPQAVPLPKFGSLDLRDDPEEIGLGAAVDVLNVDLSIPGRVASRNGYGKFTATPAAAAYTEMCPYYRAQSTTKQLVAARVAVVEALDSSGASIATSPISGVTDWSLVRYGTPTTEYVFCLPRDTPGTAFLPVKWNGTAFAAAGVPSAFGGAVLPVSNRLAILDSSLADIGCRVKFSSAGDPETFGVNDFVDLDPGDGEFLTSLTTWDRFLFAWKQSRFYVFYGTSTDGSGNPIFNYRTVNARVGAVGPRAAIATQKGVFFVGRDGVYLTTGSAPTLISQPLDPVFGRGSLPSAYQGLAVNWAKLSQAALGWLNDMLYVSLPTGSSTTNNATFVFDTRQSAWSLWDLKANAFTTFRAGTSSQDDLMFSMSSGTNDIGRVASSFTTDASAAITSRYRTGFWHPGQSGAESWVREILLEGSGTVTVKTAVNGNATLGAGAAVTLGTAPATAQGRDRRGLRGRDISYEFSGTSPWLLSTVTPIVWGQRITGEQAA